jgi:hypothetical protein
MSPKPPAPAGEQAKDRFQRFDRAYPAQPQALTSPAIAAFHAGVK